MNSEDLPKASKFTGYALNGQSESSQEAVGQKSQSVRMKGSQSEKQSESRSALNAQSESMEADEAQNRDRQAGTALEGLPDSKDYEQGQTNSGTTANDQQQQKQQTSSSKIANFSKGEKSINVPKLIPVQPKGGGPLGYITPKNIVLLVVGTRGDVQPFIQLAYTLMSHGHRVRLASHATYRDFVTNAGVEFFPLGGDPKILSEFVVKHRGIYPGTDLRGIQEQRNQVRDIIFSTWQACVSADPDGVDPQPFTADVIVSNPASYGHIHCAEMLRIPLHMVFTMPWSANGLYTAPFANLVKRVDHLDRSHQAACTLRYMSYFVVERMIWMATGDVIRSLRRSLGLTYMSQMVGAHALYCSKVPFTYIFSPTLVERPAEWGPHIEICGFSQLDIHAATGYKPDKELVAFLAAGPPPIYIGFGSLVMKNAGHLTAAIIEAFKVTGKCAIIQKGWGGLGDGLNQSSLPPGILLIDSVAHDDLFPKCTAGPDTQTQTQPQPQT
eukprot:gene6650-3309_t